MSNTTSTYPRTTDTPPGWGPPTGPAWGQNPPPVPTAKRKTGRYILGAAAVLFIIGLAGGGDKKDAASSDGVVDATTTTTATAKAATASTSNAAPSMVTWATRYGSPDSKQISVDLNALQADAEAMDISGMGTSCRTLQRHVATAKSHLPTPDAQLTSALRKAYGYYDQAMVACISGAANLDTDDLAEMSTYVSLATSSLQEATARLKVLS